MSDPIRVVIADDQSVVRLGFGSMLGGEADIAVVGQASDGEGAVRRALDLRPDVILMDVRMPGLDGVEATRRIHASDPAIGVLVITTFDLDEYVFGALRAGAAGFVLKDVDPDELLAGIRAVARGDGFIDPAVARRLIAEFGRQAPVEPDPRIDTLSEREREVLVLLTRGHSNAQIARELVLGESTVKTHVRNVLDKLGVTSRVQAVIHAYESGLVRPGDQRP